MSHDTEQPNSPPAVPGAQMEPSNPLSHPPSPTLLKAAAFVPILALVALVAVSIANMHPSIRSGIKGNRSTPSKSWISDLALPVGIEPFVYGDNDVAFGVDGGREIVAPIDGFVKVEGTSISITSPAPEKHAARTPSLFELEAAPLDTSDSDVLAYRVVRGRPSITLTPVVASGTRVARGSIIARVEGLPLPQVILGLAYTKNGKRVPPPDEIPRFARGQGVFLVHCAGCHDLTKSGNDIGPPGLHGFGDRKVMLRLKKPRTLENILASLNEGDAGMPAFKDTLTDEEKLALTEYLLTQ
jgi:mono/diheme cytochrome c family protein